MADSAGGWIDADDFLVGARGLGLGRIHPVVVTYLAAGGPVRACAAPNGVLQRNHMVLGDVTDMPSEAPAAMSQDPWYKRPIVGDHDALNCPAATESLLGIYDGQVSPDRAWISAGAIVAATRLPPLEDLILGRCRPGLIGATSGVAIIPGWIVSVYRGLSSIAFRSTIVLMLSLCC